MCELLYQLFLAAKRICLSFLDLLEHEDLTVGVMTSQILTEVHAIDPMKLEECIQDCPAGSI